MSQTGAKLQHEDPNKTGTMDGLFSLSVHPVGRGARAGNLGEKRNPGALVVHDRNGSVQLATVAEKLPNLTLLGVLDHPSCIWPREI